jgi:hypothetical protein
MNRETWLTSFADQARPHFERVGAPLPARFRMAIGFPSGGARSSTIGECWLDKASADSTWEIFITPAIDDSARVADILTHELIHAAVGLHHGHKGEFARVARALGLEGPLTATTAGQGFYDWAWPILESLGPIPHGALSAANARRAPKPKAGEPDKPADDGGADTSAKPKQSARLIKVSCDKCGAIVRASRKVIDAAGALHCISAACDGKMAVE